MVDEKPGDLKPSVSKPRIEVTFKSGGKEQRLLMGSKTPTGGTCTRGCGAVAGLSVASFWKRPSTSAFDLRDKTALEDRPRQGGARVVTGDRTIDSQRWSGWRITRRISGRTRRRSRAWCAVNSLQMKKLIEAEPRDLKSYGLDKPAATVRIGSGSSQAGLLMGSRRRGHGLRQGRVAAGGLHAGATLLDDLKKRAGEYRPEGSFRRARVQHDALEVIREGKTACSKRKGNDKDEFPEAAAKT